MSTARKLLPLPLLAILGIIAALAACGGSGDPELPEANAAAVLAYLDEVDYRNNADWRLWPGVGEKYRGGDPHGMLLTSYLNPAAYAALQANETMPPGAIIIKENYTPDGQYDANTVMYKKSGYNPEHNDWFWLKVLADGTIDKEGRVTGCQECHADAPDYVWGPQQ